jgi:hypothetical protein
MAFGVNGPTVQVPYPKIASAVIHVAHCSAVPKSTPPDRNPSFVLFLDRSSWPVLLTAAVGTQPVLLDHTYIPR